MVLEVTPDPVEVLRIERQAEKALSVLTVNASTAADKLLMRASYYNGVLDVLLDLFSQEGFDGMGEKVAAYFGAVNNDTQAIESAAHVKAIFGDAMDAANAADNDGGKDAS